MTGATGPTLWRYYGSDVTDGTDTSWNDETHTMWNDGSDGNDRNWNDASDTYLYNHCYNVPQARRTQLTLPMSMSNKPGEHIPLARCTMPSKPMKTSHFPMKSSHYPMKLSHYPDEHVSLARWTRLTSRCKRSITLPLVRWNRPVTPKKTSH